MDYRLKRGDIVRVRHVDDTEWCGASVVAASATNPQSVGLMLDGAVRDGHGGLIAQALPLFVDYQTQTVTSLVGDEYEIDVASFQGIERLE